MRKVYTTPEYKEHHKSKLLRIERRARIKSTPLSKEEKEKKKSKKKKLKKSQEFKNNSNLLSQVCDAPEDFRLVENTEGCLLFFRNVRDEKNIFYSKNYKFIRISLAEVEQIDYATISILTAISDDLMLKGIILRGDFPKNQECTDFIRNSGFLNHMVNDKNQKFPKATKSDLLFFEKGCGVLSNEDNRKISQLVEDVILYLTGEQAHFKPVKSILLEICGNSIEWANTANRQWVLGVQYEDDKVVFTVTDVGKGILDTLHRKFDMQLSDFFKGRSNLEILYGAFQKKYGSTTQETNRNKGLPAVKASSDRGIIANLIVLTNNVILHFHNNKASRVFKMGSPRFKGTIYQWELTQDCLTKTQELQNDNN